jgi:hypothetical protein
MDTPMVLLGLDFDGTSVRPVYVCVYVSVSE